MAFGAVFPPAGDNVTIDASPFLGSSDTVIQKGNNFRLIVRLDSSNRILYVEVSVKA